MAFNGTRVAAQMATEPTGEPRARPGRLAGRRAGNPITDASEHLVNRELVAAALGRLTQEHRDVLRECYFRGSSVAKAAYALEITPDMVKARAYYALRALRLAIEELEGVP
jgi:RNA polymerase sigma-70 factor (ECF subfamily)